MATPTAERPVWLRKLDFLWLEITRKCNLRCVHCYADSGPELPLRQGMSYADWVRVLRQASALGCRDVQFIGGEPALCPDLPRLLADARRVGFDSVEVYTNGTLLSRMLRHALVKQEVGLAFSVYGSRTDVHDRVTCQPGSFAKTIDNIRWALQAGLPVRASIVEMPSSAGDTRATRALLRRLGVRTIDADRTRGVGRGRALTATETPEPLEELCGECWRGKLAIDPSGNVFPCVFARWCRVGHASESLASILHSEPLHSFRREVREMSKPKPRPKRKRRPKKGNGRCNPLKRKKKGVCNPFKRKKR